MNDKKMYMKWCRAETNIRRKVAKLNQMVKDRSYCFIEVNHKKKQARYEGDPCIASALSTEVCERVSLWVQSRQISAGKWPN